MVPDYLGVVPGYLGRVLCSPGWGGWEEVVGMVEVVGKVWMVGVVEVVKKLNVPRTTRRV